MQEETLERKGRKEPHNLCCYLPSGLNPEGSGAFALTAPNSTEEDAAAREFLIQQAAEKKVNELAFQLSQTEQMIEDINEGQSSRFFAQCPPRGGDQNNCSQTAWEEKVRQSESLLQERTRQLQGTGISFQRSPSSVRLDRQLPSLVNLNEGQGWRPREAKTED